MIKVLISAGIKDALSELYSSANKSGVRFPTPFIRIKPTRNAITATLGRGVTLLKGEGAYTGRAKNVILCVIKKQQIMDVRRIIKSIDTHAFLIVTEAKDVYGNGFGDITNES